MQLFTTIFPANSQWVISGKMDTSSMQLEDPLLGPRPFGCNEVNDAMDHAQGRINQLSILLKVEQLLCVPLP